MNGERSELNNFMLDGVDNNAYGTSLTKAFESGNAAEPGRLQQFKVETNNYSAEYDHAAGRRDQRHHQERHQRVSWLAAGNTTATRS